MTAAQPAPQAPPRLDLSETTASQMFDDLTGLEEMAIARAFRLPVNELAKDPTQFLRALVFADLRRSGQPDKAAFLAAQDMRLGHVRSYFKDEDDQPTAGGTDDDSDDEDDEGKGGR